MAPCRVNEAISCTSRGKSSGPLGVGSDHASSNGKSRDSSWILLWRAARVDGRRRAPGPSRRGRRFPYGPDGNRQGRQPALLAPKITAEVYWGHADQDQSMTPENIATLDRTLTERGAPYDPALRRSRARLHNVQHGRLQPRRLRSTLRGAVRAPHAHTAVLSAETRASASRPRHDRFRRHAAAPQAMASATEGSCRSGRPRAAAGFHYRPDPSDAADTPASGDGAGNHMFRRHPAFRGSADGVRGASGWRPSVTACSSSDAA